MAKTLEKLGRSLMLPASILPAAALLAQLGQWLGHTGLEGASWALIQAGSLLLANSGLLFALGVAAAFGRDDSPTALLCAAISWLLITGLLVPATVGGMVPPSVLFSSTAFATIQNGFTGALCGFCGAFCARRFAKASPPGPLQLFTGRTAAAIASIGLAAGLAVVLFFLLPLVYGLFSAAAPWLAATGAAGAGLYGLFSSLLLPLGLRQPFGEVILSNLTANYVPGTFWIDATCGILKETGSLMVGRFPIAMLGLPGGALALWHTALPGQKKKAGRWLLAAALASAITGITLPLELCFIFIAPALFIAHGLLTGLSHALCALLPLRAGYSVGAGLLEWGQSFLCPAALNPWLMLPVGLLMGGLYYLSFRLLVLRFCYQTPGRQREDYSHKKAALSLSGEHIPAAVTAIIQGLGGPGNIHTVGNCLTRLRVEVKDPQLVNEAFILSSGAAAVLRPGKCQIQVVVGPQVQLLAQEANRQITHHIKE